MTKVIIVEDDNDLRESLVECLELEEFQVHGVSSALELYGYLSGEVCDVAVVDVGLPDQDGFIIDDCLRRNTTTRIILLTARGAMEDKVRGYKAGADVYLVKPVPCEELAAVIHSVASRGVGVDGVVAEPVTAEDVWTLSARTYELIPPESDPIRMTEKEFQLLKVLCTSEEMRGTREEILDGLGYRQDEFADRALNSLVLRLRKKIELAIDAESPIRTAHGVGFFFSSPLVMK